jgi:hypothetical protein
MRPHLLLVLFPFLSALQANYPLQLLLLLLLVLKVQLALQGAVSLCCHVSSWAG